MNEREETLSLALRASVLGRAMISACGRFLPYAARVDREGQVLCLADGVLDDDMRRIETLWTTLGDLQQAHGDDGGAVVYDAVVHDDSGMIAEAVVVEVRCEQQKPFRALLPYERRSNDVVFGQPSVEGLDA